MGQIILYIAASLDGFIARPDGNLDWLTSVPDPENGDYGYAELLAGIGTTIMGRKTYDEVLGFGIEWPYHGLITYVITHDRNYKAVTPDTYIVNAGINDFVRELKSNTDRDIWLIGGGQLITYFINNDLTDRMILTIVPLILGDGIPLFPGKPKETTWALSGVRHYSTGLVSLTYDRMNTQL